MVCVCAALALGVHLVAWRWLAVDERSQVQRLLDELAKITEPDIGFAPWMSGSQFAPVHASRRFESGILGMDHGLRTHPALVELVELGPRAIPDLLAALDDPTPTQRVQEHPGHFGSMRYGREVRTNPGNVAESEIVARDGGSRGMELFGPGSDPIGRHTLTIGDMAFVALGQIVNRKYQAIRYQPTGILVVNSPTHDPAIAAFVRELWSSDDAETKLYESLLADYRSVRPTPPDPPAFDGWDPEVRHSAAMRLAFYFPERSRELLAQDIDRIPPLSEWEGGPWQDPSAPTIELLSAVAFSSDPVIRAAVKRCVERAESAALEAQIDATK